MKTLTPKDQTTWVITPQLRIMMELIAIAPSWRTVELTKAGYNAQYIETLGKLKKYVSKKIAEAKNDPARKA